MKCKKSLFYLFLVAILGIVTACNSSDNGDNVENDETNEEASEEEPNNEVSNDDESESEVENEEESQSEEQNQSESEEVSFEVKTAPEDQGDRNVWFDGEIKIVDKVVTATGTTNLLPDSRLTLIASPQEGVIIGGSWRDGSVSESGEFQIEKELPDELEGLTHIELKFEVGRQLDEEIKSHYLEGEGITGNFVERYRDSVDDESYKKASFQSSVYIDDQEQSIEITEPTWDIPEDLGDTNVRIDQEITKENEYIVLHLNTNLLDGTYISAKADIPGYITTGFSGSTNIRPDGSGVIYIKDPEQDGRIKGIEEYEINITMDPSSHENGPHIKEIYGENGENLEGEYVKETDDGKEIKQNLVIPVE